jgi:TIR domain
MLKKDLELIVQYPDAGHYVCRGFRGLYLSAPVYLVFDGAQLADQSVANLLGSAFCAELLRYAAAGEESMMPCGVSSAVRCHATEEPTCRKILVRPAATVNPPGVNSWPRPSAEAIWLSNSQEPTWEVVLPMPVGTQAELHLPTEWQGINASFWRTDPTETIWGIMQRVGLAPEDSRLFISYVRRDTMAVADQLFHALTEEGFDVFLDRFSVPVGVQFQERLMQDISDKAMVVLLNSQHVAAGPDQSAWVEQEISKIKIYRLGLLELCFPKGLKRTDLDPDYSSEVKAEDLEPAGPDYAAGSLKFTKAKLADVVGQIKLVHGRALHRRRNALITDLALALKDAGRIHELLANGTFHLPADGPRSEAIVGLSARPPELADFCSLHQRGGISASRVGWLISPAPFFRAQRQAQMGWLSGVSNIQHADEAQILKLAAKL